MKIAINGEIIDTKDIYKIGEIYEDYDNILVFKVYLFNNHTIEVSLILPIDYHNYSGIISRKETPYNGIIMSDATMDDFRKMPEYIEAHTRISNLRNEIIKIWSENQSEIPQFNLE